VIGIRATCPNEIWHIDVSVFVLPNKTKCYIQAVVDNYSRFAIAWQVLGSYDGSSTVGLLRKALEIVNSQVQDNKKLRLIVDAGGENKNHEMDSLEGEGRFRKEVARFEISYSNSMIEAVFRSLKHNYLFQHEIVDLPALRRHVNFWFREHNEKIPHTAIKGETPAERFNREWSNEKEIRILLRQEEAIKLRIAENQKVSCEGCGIA
jgi:transposase InsO family protein